MFEEEYQRRLQEAEAMNDEYVEEDYQRILRGINSGMSVSSRNYSPDLEDEYNDLINENQRIPKTDEEILTELEELEKEMEEEEYNGFLSPQAEKQRALDRAFSRF